MPLAKRRRPTTTGCFPLLRLPHLALHTVALHCALRDVWKFAVQCARTRAIVDAADYWIDRAARYFSAEGALLVKSAGVNARDAYLHGLCLYKCHAAAALHTDPATLTMSMRHVVASADGRVVVYQKGSEGEAFFARDYCTDASGGVWGALPVRSAEGDNSNVVVSHHGTWIGARLQRGAVTATYCTMRYDAGAATYRVCSKYAVTATGFALLAISESGAVVHDDSHDTRYVFGGGDAADIVDAAHVRVTDDVVNNVAPRFLCDMRHLTALGLPSRGFAVHAYIAPTEERMAFWLEIPRDVGFLRDRCVTAVYHVATHSLTYLPVKQMPLPPRARLLSVFLALSSHDGSALSYTCHCGTRLVRHTDVYTLSAADGDGDGGATVHEGEWVRALHNDNDDLVLDDASINCSHADRRVLSWRLGVVTMRYFEMVPRR